MCQGDPMGAGVLVAIMGPPEIKESNSYFIKCHFYTNGAKGTKGSDHNAMYMSTKKRIK